MIAPTVTAAATIRAQLDVIEKSLAALESQMTSLRAQKERLLEDLENLTYPVLTLPDDITIVFLHVVSAVMLDEYSKARPYYDLLRLASVCQTWRAVMVSTCALWNDGYMFCDGIRDAGKTLEMCLAYAGSLPLDLKIWVPDDMDMILSTLSLYGSQWRHLSLCRSDNDIPIIFPLDHFPSSLPLLESLELCNLLVEDDPVSSLCHAPQLRELSLRSSSWAIQLGLPFNRLTKFDLRNFSITQLLVVLPQVPSLESLVFVCTKYAQVAPPSILLPCLHTLTCDDPSTVLQYLILPALEKLHLWYLSEEDVHAIHSCVARSHSTIFTLGLYHPNYDEAYDCLCGLPTIRHLKLWFPSWHYDDDDSLFTALISGICLPALESLTWEGCKPDRAHKLFVMVSARWRGVEGTAKLNSVSLGFPDGEDSEAPYWNEYVNAINQLYELGRQGLELKITGALAGAAT
ncbi:hypothetical protein GGX14DRAFT_625443 [Mycena pura]|uniref:F-box domain-containing protein n=1 Tax=Mycena pura TaxID=153505 RepID=A0AAD6VI92_9AGAR|nr:hypothetical protein GGX14DRAFT_625443 [Mycena pura]